jgi:hypothetical protein
MWVRMGKILVVVLHEAYNQQAAHRQPKVLLLGHRV